MNSKILRLGIVGAGRVVEQFHLPALRANAGWRLLCLVDPDPVRRQWAERAVPQAEVYGDPSHIFERGDLDAVLVATPPNTHLELTRQALEACLHVLVEKPGGLSLAQAGEMVDAAERAGRLLRVGFNRRLMPSYQRLRQRLQMTGIEQIQSLSARLVFSLDEWVSASGYLGNSSQGGGVIHDVASHLIDAIPWLLADRIKSFEVNEAVVPADGNGFVRFRVIFESGVQADIFVAHGQHYLEEVKVQQADRVLHLYPMDVINIPIQLANWSQSLAHCRYWLDRKVARLGLQIDPMLAAAQNLWHSFADELHGESEGVTLVDGNRLVEIHENLTQLDEKVARKFG